MINSLTTHFLKENGYLDALNEPIRKEELRFTDGGDVFRLSSLAGIYKLRQTSGSVKRIDVSKNMLTNIEDLCAITSAESQLNMYCDSVKEINARHNVIERISKSESNFGWVDKMVNLKHLDLSYNRLECIPNLSTMPVLRVLLLNNNKIISKNFAEHLRHGHQLRTLDLSNNQIEFRTSDQLIDAFKAGGCGETGGAETLHWVHVHSHSDSHCHMHRLQESGSSADIEHGGQPIHHFQYRNAMAHLGY